MAVFDNKHCILYFFLKKRGQLHSLFEKKRGQLHSLFEKKGAIAFFI